MAEVGIGVLGAGGRMGLAVVRAVAESPDAFLVGGTARAGSLLVGQDMGVIAGLEPMDLTITDDDEAVFDKADAVIDFTAPAATARHAALAAARGTALILGSTGLTPKDQESVAEAARVIPVVQAANFSLGVNLLKALVERTAAILDDGFDIEIVEMHHRHKVDAPSGTALALGEAAAAGRGVALDRVSDRGRDGVTGERERGHIGFASLRGGDVAGEHSVIFAGPGERLELAHKATDRMIFARGAVKAALWAHGCKPGFYGMAEVLGF